MLATPWQNATTFNAASQTFVFDIMFAYVKERISTVPLLEVCNPFFNHSLFCFLTFLKIKDWRAIPKPNDSGMDLPSYQHPLSYITQIGDHLLTTLPQQLEPYADTLVFIILLLLLLFIYCYLLND